MHTLNNYYITDKSFWTGRIDDPDDTDSFRMHQVIECIDLKNNAEFNTEGKLNICLLGFCCDEGVKRNLGRQGAVNGPESIRKEFANLPFRFDKQIKIFDAGDIFCKDENLEEAQKSLGFAVEIILKKGMYPIIMGGGHEIAYGHYKGLKLFSRDLNSNQKIGIINFDAHFDLRPYNGSGSSGTMFSQIAFDCKKNEEHINYLCLGIQTYANTISLFKKAEELGVKHIKAVDFTEQNHKKNLKIIEEFINSADNIYLTVCSDVFNSANAPGVSAIQPFGMDPEIVLKYIKEILKSNKTISFDIAEVSPRFDFDNRTSKLASVIIYSVINTLTEIKI